VLSFPLHNQLWIKVQKMLPIKALRLFFSSCPPLSVNNYYTPRSLPQLYISVIPAWPESFFMNNPLPPFAKGESEGFPTAGMTIKPNIQFPDALRSLP
jgi:hypothetical protein